MRARLPTRRAPRRARRRRSSAGTRTRMQFPGTPALSRIRPRCERRLDHRLRELGRRLLRPAIVDELRSPASRRGRARRRSAGGVPARRACAPGSLSPITFARATRSSSSNTSSTASAAASATGIADERAADRARCPASMISAPARSRRTSGRPGRDRLRDGDQVGLARCSAPSRTSAPVRPKPVCTSSATRTMPCRSHSARSPSTNAGRRGHEAALALLRLEHDRGDVRLAARA